MVSGLSVSTGFKFNDVLSRGIYKCLKIKIFLFGVLLKVLASS